MCQCLLVHSSDELFLWVPQGNLHNSIDSKRRTEDAFSAAQSALQSMKQKAGAYRKVRMVRMHACLQGSLSWRFVTYLGMPPTPDIPPVITGEQDAAVKL